MYPCEQQSSEVETSAVCTDTCEGDPKESSAVSGHAMPDSES